MQARREAQARQRAALSKGAAVNKPVGPTLIWLLLGVAAMAAIPAMARAQGAQYPITIVAPGKGPYTFPDGYQTPVGDGGRPLSSGERRRIGLARAFLRDAPLVILDEPTADLDAGNAGLVANAVRRLQFGRTVLLIAHRPELVRHAHRVVRLLDGVVAPGGLAEAA